MDGKPIKADNRPTKETTFQEFAKTWLDNYVKANNRLSEITRKESVFNCNLLPFFGSLPLKEITNRKVEEYKAMRLNKICVKTLKNEVSMLRTCLSTAVEWEYLDTMPSIKMPKAPETSINWLPENDCDKLLQATDGMLHDMIFLAIKTGLRFGELIALEWPDFNFDNKTLTINKSIVLNERNTTKSGKVRYIPLTASVCDYFSIIKQNSGLVFHEPNGDFVHQKRICYHLEQAYKKAGLAPHGWHTLRHSFASHLVSKGASILAIKELLGHSDIKTTLVYAHLAPSITTSTIALLT
jgi:integrase